MSSSYAVYVSVLSNCHGGFDYFFFRSSEAVGYDSLSQWMSEVLTAESEHEDQVSERVEREMNEVTQRVVRERMERGLCSCGGVTPPGKLDCVDCHDYRGWFR